MKMKKNFSLLIFVFLSLVLMTSIVFAADADKIVFRFAHINAPEHTSNLAAVKFAELVGEKTNGRVEVQVYPAAQLGNYQELLEGVQQGTIMFTYNTMSGFGTLYEEFGAFDTPYLFQDVDSFLKAVDLNGPLMGRLNQELIERSGVQIIGVYFAGIRHLTLDRAIYHPDDLKGLKVRSQTYEMFTAAVEGLGAIPIPLAWSEVPTALLTGQIQGQENPYSTIWAQKVYEIQSHVMETGHIFAATGYVMNAKIFQELDADLQNAILEAAQEVTMWRTENRLEEDETCKQECIKAGMTIITPENGLDIEAFRERSKALVEERFGEKYKEFYKQIDEMLK